MSGTVHVALPDGSNLTVPAGTTVESIAAEVGAGLAKDCIAGRLDGQLLDKRTPITEDATVTIVTPDSEDVDAVHRRTAGVLLAVLLQQECPDATHAEVSLGDDRFAVDVDLGDGSINKDARETLQRRLAELAEDGRTISRTPIEGSSINNQYARSRRHDGERLATYRVDGVGSVVDTGPVLERTDALSAVQLLSISAVYWQGDEEAGMLTRLSGTAFASQAALNSFLDARSEKARKDHRRLNAEMDLFSIPSTSPGCVSFHPNGMSIRREIESLVQQINDELGYEEVWTPHLNKTNLWKRTNHYQHFIEEGHAFAWDESGEEYGVKPVNCPSHMYLYNRNHRSYRDLPIRYFENVPIYRNEQSGELSGLTRLQAFTQDDGHAFLRPDQVENEIARVLKIIKEIPEILGMSSRLELQMDQPQQEGAATQYRKATETIRTVLSDLGWEYTTVTGKGAFYAPKVDCVAEDDLGQEWVLGGIQLDRILPEEFGLTYTDETGDRQRPVVLHRILIGSYERLLAAIIEHFGGDLPFWIAPEQLRILPITDDHTDYAERIADELSTFRVSVETRSWTLAKQIRRAHEDRVPYMLIVGDSEVASETASVRTRDERRLGSFKIDRLRDRLQAEYENRRRDLALEPADD